MIKRKKTIADEIYAADELTFADSAGGMAFGSGEPLNEFLEAGSNAVTIGTLGDDVITAVGAGQLGEPMRVYTGPGADFIFSMDSGEDLFVFAGSGADAFVINDQGATFDLGRDSDTDTIDLYAMRGGTVGYATILNFTADDVINVVGRDISVRYDDEGAWIESSGAAIALLDGVREGEFSI